MVDQPDDLVALELVPVDVFGASCTCCQDRGDCRSSYGLMDAVQAWSDCNRAQGRIYRVEDVPGPRRPGDTVEVFVRRRDLPFFERHFDADAT